MRLKYFKIIIVLAASVAFHKACCVTLDNGMALQGSLLIGSGYDSNVALMNENPLSSAFLETQGMVSVLANLGAMEHSFDLKIDDRRYTSSGQDDYSDWSTSYFGYYEPTSRQRAEIAFSRNNLHQQRGIGYTRYLEVPLSKPLRYSQNNARIKYEYGSLAATGQIGFEFQYTDLVFDNFASFTNRLNYEAPTVRAWFDYNVGVVTS